MVTTVIEHDERVTLERLERSWQEALAPYDGGFQLQLVRSERRVAEVAAAEWAAHTAPTLHQRAYAAIVEDAGGGRRLDETTYAGYDAFGVPHSIRSSSVAGTITDVVLVFDAEYACGSPPQDRIDRWIIGLPDRVITTSWQDGAAETRTTAYCWNDDGLLTEVQREPDVPLADPDALRLTTTIVRNGHGQPITITESPSHGDPRVHRITYDEWSVHPRSYRNPADHLSWVGYHPTLGVPLIQVDPNGATHRYRYDSLGRVRESVRADGSGGTVSYGAGSLTSTALGGAAFTTLVDRLGRPTSVSTTGLGGVGIASGAVYDRLGHVVTEHLPRIGGGPMVHRDFDVMGRLRDVTVERSSGSTQQVLGIERQFAGDEVTIQEADGDRRRTHRDRDGLLDISTELDGLTDPQVELEPAPFGQVAEVRSTGVGGATRTATFVHDRLGRRLQSSDDDRGVLDYAYDAWGNVVSVQREGVPWITISYDALDRPYRIETSEGLTEVSWDTSEHGVGQIGYALSPDGSSVEYVYDSLGRVSATLRHVRGREFRLDYDYDSLGRLSGIRYPETPAGRLRVGYHYDPSSGVLVMIDDDTGNIYWELGQHDAFFRPTEEAIGGGWLSTRYDEVHGRPTSMTLRKERSATAAPLREIVQEFEPDGTLHKRRETMTGREEEFAYDALDRLTFWYAWSPEGWRVEQYEPAPNGNIDRVYHWSGNATSSTSTTETYHYSGIDAGPSAVTEIDVEGGPTPGTRFYRYDAMGRQWYADGRFVTYTSSDLPRTIDDGGMSASYEYGPFGERVVEELYPSGRVTTYIDEMYELHQEGTTEGHVLHVYGPHGRLAQVTIDGTASIDRSFFVHDDLGSVRFVTDSSGMLRDELFYDPFGRRLLSDATDAPHEAPEKGGTRGFTGHLHDDAFGLINMRGREFDPTTRRFLSADPVVPGILSAQSWNAYSYVWNGPTNAVDPSGFDGVRVTEGPTTVECIPNCPDWPPPRESAQERSVGRAFDGRAPGEMPSGGTHSASGLRGSDQIYNPSPAHTRAVVQQGGSGSGSAPGGPRGPEVGFADFGVLGEFRVAYPDSGGIYIPASIAERYSDHNPGRDLVVDLSQGLYMNFGVQLSGGAYDRSGGVRFFGAVVPMIVRGEDVDDVDSDAPRALH